MEEDRTPQSDEVLPKDEYNDNKMDSSATDSFSEDDIDYSPRGFDFKTIPGKIQMEPCQNKHLERLITLVTEDTYMTGRIMIYHHIGTVLPEKTQSFIVDLKQAKQVETGSNIFLSRSLYATFRIGDKENEAPGMTLLDVLIFSPNFPVTILTLPDSSKEREACRKYNTYLASWLTETLRDNDGSLSVLHGVVDINDDLSQTLDKLRQQKLCFSFADAVTMTPERCRQALKDLLNTLASRETNEALQKISESSILKVWTIMDLNKELSDPMFEDFMCTLSREFNMFLHVEDLSLLTEPLKEKLIANRARLVDTIQADSSKPDWDLYVEGCKKQTLWSVNVFPYEEKQNPNEQMSTLPQRVITLVFWLCALCIVQFILSFRGEMEGLFFEFTEQKIIPVSVLLWKVHRLKPERDQKQYWCLGCALLLSCIADLLSEWIHFLNFGILLFAVVNMLFALTFRLDKFMVLIVIVILGTGIFQTVNFEVEGKAYYIVLLYAVAVCLLSWHIYAGLETYDGVSYWAIVQIICLGCFVVCNVITGYKFLHPHVFPGADLLSKLIYHFNELVATTCLLVRNEMFGDFVKESRWLEYGLILFVLLNRGVPILKHTIM